MKNHSKTLSQVTREFHSSKEEMDVVAFHWGENGSLSLVQNRENYESMGIKAAAWDKEILGGFFTPNGGTWLGCSKNGRIAFLSEKLPFDSNSRSELLPLAFLKGNQTPEEFGNQVAGEEVMYRGLAFHLVVATPNSNSMFYIGKANVDSSDVIVSVVEYGLHVLSPDGLDANENDKYNDLRSKFLANFGEIDNTNLRTFAEIMRTGTDVNLYFQDMRNAPIDERTVVTRRGTTSTTALVVQPGGRQIFFYENYLNNDDWKETTFDYIIN